MQRSHPGLWITAGILLGALVGLANPYPVHAEDEPAIESQALKMHPKDLARYQKLPGWPQYQARIINGTTTTGFPTVGLMRMNTPSGNFICTGTLVTADWVLSAAHCLEDATAGGTTFEVGGVQRTVSKIVVHPNYNPNNFSAGFDIAMFKLTNPVTTIAPSQIQTSVPTVGQSLTLVGYGVGGTPQSGGQNGTSGVKRTGQAVIDSVTAQHTRWTYTNATLANTCFGDSGGPQFNTTAGVVSVTSGGGGNCQIGTVSFNTRCDIFFTWMQGVVNDNPGGADWVFNWPSANSTWTQNGNQLQSGNLSWGTVYDYSQYNLYFVVGNITGDGVNRLGVAFGNPQQISGSVYQLSGGFTVIPVVGVRN